MCQPDCSSCQKSSSPADLSGEFALQGGPDVPAAWAGTYFDTNEFGCEASQDSDNVTKFDLTLTETKEDRVKGSFEVEIQGGGPRSEDVATSEGDFDLVPTRE